MTPLRQRLIDDLRLRNYSPRTIQAYVAAVLKLTRFFRLAPELLSAEQIRQFQIHLVQQRVSFSLLNQVTAGLHFFYTITLGRPDVVHKMAYGKRPKKLPTILAPDEVLRLFDAAPNDRDRTLLRTDYALGLRISELVALRLDDIDAARGIVHVHQGKSAKDRLVSLSSRLLEELRSYWRRYRPRPWLFAGRRPGEHISVGMVQRIVRCVVRRRPEQSHQFAFVTALLRHASRDPHPILAVAGHWIPNGLLVRYSKEDRPCIQNRTLVRDSHEEKHLRPPPRLPVRRLAGLALLLRFGAAGPGQADGPRSEQRRCGQV